MTYCIAFEAKSIQGYVLGSGKLRDMVGASRIVDALVEKPLDAVLRALGLREGEDIRFSRRAGGAFMAFVDREDAARSLVDLWSLLVPQYAPGLEFILATGEGADEREAARKALNRLQASRFPMPRIPQATPLARLAPRTGLPAVAEMRGPEGRLWVDASSRRKAEVEEDSLSRKFLGEVKGSFPRNLEQEFPMHGDNRYVGIVHADGNGLGQMLQSLQKLDSGDFVKLYSTFSEKLAKATREAAQMATEAIVLPHADKQGYLPMRPLVLGGDDLTCIVRGDLALAFTRVFLESFEEATRELCDFLKEQTEWNQEHLTACAGIAYVKINQPFALAYELAEGLCSHAKNRSGRKASAVAFHRVTTSFVPDVDWMIEREMTTGMHDLTLVTTLGAYRVGQVDATLPALEDLTGLLSLMAGDRERSTAGRMRSLLSLSQEPPEEARRLYGRWRKLFEEEDKAWLERFDAALERLLGEVSEDLPARKLDARRYESPLGDVLALQAVEDSGVKSEKGDGNERDAA